MIATWVIGAILGTDHERIQVAANAPAKISPPSTPRENKVAQDPDPIFANLGATSTFTQDDVWRLSADKFETAAVASSSPPAAPAPAEVPLPPNRDLPAVAAYVPPPVRDVPVVAETVPLPPSRPLFDSQPDVTILYPRAGRATPEAIAGDIAPAAPDNRNLMQKLLNQPPQPAGPVLAYARPEDGDVSAAPDYGKAIISPIHDDHTAIYDVAAHTVYMPDGERLEAHSGLGRQLDDPRSAGEKNRGATPPHAYDLELRKQLFHGVRALRLDPVGGGNMYGRTGLLAHTYMLGANGQSNGCVSLKDYAKFLRAYLRGDITRLVVVAHLG